MARTTEFSGERSAATSSDRSGKADDDASDSLDPMASARPRGRSYDEGDQWRPAVLFGAGIAVGALIGAGAALLFAPLSGEETRELISDRAQRLGGGVSERFGDVRGDLGRYLRRGRRKLGRGVSRGRWAGEDIASRMRRGW